MPVPTPPAASGDGLAGGARPGPGQPPSPAVGWPELPRQPWRWSLRSRWDLVRLRENPVGPSIEPLTGSPGTVGSRGSP